MKTIILVFLVLAIFNNYLPAEAKALPKKTDGYYYVYNRRSGLVMSVENGKTSSGARIVQYKNDGKKYHQWDMRYYEEGGKKYYVFVNRNSGKVLDVPNQSKNNGVQLIQKDYNGGKNQEYRLLKTSGKYYRMECRHSGKYVDVKDASPNKGAPLVQKAKKNIISQEWYFEKV